MNKIKKKERAWVEIKLDNIKHNYFELKKLTDMNIIAVLKADAYGHGAYQVGKTLFDLGVKHFAVATIEEALELKNIGADVLILGFTPGDKLELVIKNNFEQSVFDFNTAVKISSIAQKLNLKAKVHIKIDTGMHRLGFSATQKTIDVIKKINNLPNIVIKGIFSHFAQSDIPNDKFTLEQYQKFSFITHAFKNLNLINHISNSAAIVNYPEFECDFVRAGLFFYGLLYFTNGKINLMPALELKSQIVDIKKIKAHESVSYNRSFFADKNTKIGIVSIGYADGYPRSASNRTSVVVNGKLAPVVGSVCMDYLMINLNNIDAKVGSEVILIGSGNGLSVSAEDLAKINNTISYEVITSIGKRIPRYYI